MAQLVEHSTPDRKAIGSSPIILSFKIYRTIPYGVTASISGFHPGDPGSIPGKGNWI